MSNPGFVKYILSISGQVRVCGTLLFGIPFKQHIKFLLNISVLTPDFCSRNVPILLVCQDGLKQCPVSTT